MLAHGVDAGVIFSKRTGAPFGDPVIQCWASSSTFGGLDPALKLSRLIRSLRIGGFDATQVYFGRIYKQFEPRHNVSDIRQNDNVVAFEVRFRWMPSVEPAKQKQSLSKFSMCVIPSNYQVLTLMRIYVWLLKLCYETRHPYLGIQSCTTSKPSGHHVDLAQTCVAGEDDLRQRDQNGYSNVEVNWLGKHPSVSRFAWTWSGPLLHCYASGAPL